MLLDHGYTNVRNLEGGIRRWAEKIDPALKVI
jgi:rhodanese-related sulfurtransferase